MDFALEEINTLTAMGPTTIPESMRRALGVDYGGRIPFPVSHDWVVAARADGGKGPGDWCFSGLSGRRNQTPSEAVKALVPGPAARITALTTGIDADVAVLIDGNVALCPLDCRTITSRSRTASQRIEPPSERYSAQLRWLTRCNHVIK